MTKQVEVSVQSNTLDTLKSIRDFVFRTEVGSSAIELQTKWHHSQLRIKDASIRVQDAKSRLPMAEKELLRLQQVYKIQQGSSLQLDKQREIIKKLKLQEQGWDDVAIEQIIQSQALKDDLQQLVTTQKTIESCNEYTDKVKKVRESGKGYPKGMDNNIIRENEVKLDTAKRNFAKILTKITALEVLSIKHLCHEDQLMAKEILSSSGFKGIITYSLEHDVKPLSTSKLKLGQCLAKVILTGDWEVSKIISKPATSPAIHNVKCSSEYKTLALQAQQSYQEEELIVAKEEVLSKLGASPLTQIVMEYLKVSEKPFISHTQSSAEEDETVRVEASTIPPKTELEKVDEADYDYNGFEVYDDSYNGDNSDDSHSGDDSEYDWYKAAEWKNAAEETSFKEASSFVLDDLLNRYKPEDHADFLVRSLGGECKEVLLQYLSSHNELL